MPGGQRRSHGAEGEFLWEEGGSCCVVVYDSWCGPRQFVGYYGWGVCGGAALG